MLHPQRIPYFLLYPSRNLSFYNLPLESSMVPQPGGGADIKCNSPFDMTCHLKIN